ncbi:hypothetical protein Tco_1379945 [Tanacetum coccineum]
MGTMWCLFDPTPSDWCKMDANSTDFASNWLERLPTGSISTREDLTTRFLGQFFPPGRTAKLQNDILIYQTRFERVLSDFDSCQERRLSSIGTQLKQQQDDEAPQSKGIKSPSKLLSLKYQSQSSLGEQNRSSSSPKRVYFVNTIIVIRKEDESREAGTIGSDTAEDIGRDTIIEVDKKVEEGLDGSKIMIKEDEPRDIKQNKLDDRTCGETKEVDEVEMESEESAEEIKEEEEDDPKFFDTFPTIEELERRRIGEIEEEGRKKKEEERRRKETDRVDRERKIEKERKEEEKKEKRVEEGDRKEEREEERREVEREEERRKQGETEKETRKEEAKMNKEIVE